VPAADPGPQAPPPAAPGAPTRQGRRIVLVLLLLLGALLTSMHAYVVNYGENRGMRKERHERILSMTGEAPWAYRVLSPALAEGTARVVGPLMARPIDRRESGYLLWRLVWTSGFLVAFHRLLERWLPPTWALLGAVLVAALHGPSYLHYWYQPDSPGDLFAWTLAALLTVQGRDRWLFPLMVIAALNRETAVFIAPIHLALRWGEEPAARTLGRAAGLGLCWLLPYLGLRAWIPVEGWAGGMSVADIILANLTSPEWLGYAALFLGAWAPLALLDWRDKPPALRRLMLVMLPYLGLIVAFGRVREVRLLLPLSLALVPSALLSLRARLEPGAGPSSPSPSPPPPSP
jgi:hypothetical protein